jgi:hypothetical protein
MIAGNAVLAPVPINRRTSDPLVADRTACPNSMFPPASFTETTSVVGLMLGSVTKTFWQPNW